MEDRTLLSAVGTEVPFFYATDPDQTYADVAQIMGGWGRLVEGAWSRDDSVPRSGAGYALRPATTFAVLASYPDGMYQVSFKGRAAVEFSGIGSLVGPLTTGADGITRGIVQVGGSAGVGSADRMLYMTITSTDAGNPMSELHVWTPGHSDGGSLFTEEYVASLKPFGFLRVMQWNDTINSTTARWSQRVLEDSFGQEKVLHSYEELIALANETGNDLWLTVPALADDDYLRNLASLVHDRLDPSLKLYIEYSNETWNYYFGGFDQVYNIAKADPRVTATNSMAMVAQETGLQAARVGLTFLQEFGAESDRVIPVFAGWTIFPDFLQQGLDAVARVYGNPSSIFKATAIAPYVDIADSLAGSKDLDALIASMSSAIDTAAIYMKRNAQVAASFGLPLGAYESGVHATTVVDANVRNALATHPAMYDLYKKYYAAWTASGGDFMSFYTVFDVTSFWGLKRDLEAIGSPKWDAVMSLLLAAGDADADGEVDYADFQIVAANMGRGGVWWAQGDFDHDGKVDRRDLNLLLSNLDFGSLTADQAADIALRFAPTTTTATESTSFQVFPERPATDLATAASGSFVKDGVLDVGTGTGRMSLGGVAHPSGLGVSGGSVVTLPLGGAYTNFSAIIGVDDRALMGSGDVVFSVVGDGRILYKSPAMGSGAGLPISVDVTGVSSLSLMVSAPANANLRVPADWAMARLVDARTNSGAVPTLSWTVSRNGETISSLTGPSFVFSPTGIGDYVVTVDATDSKGDVSRKSVSMRVGPPVNQASAIPRESRLSGGNWISVVGREAALLAGESGVYAPNSSATISASGAATTIWSRSTTDPRSLANRFTDGRLASAWTGDSFTIAVNFSDKSSHRVSLYLLDWDFGRRMQRVDVLDAATGTILDSRSFTSFESGTHATWDVSGNVLFRVVKTSGASAAVSGVFIDGVPSAELYAGADSLTRGAWPGTYGTAGQALAGIAPSLPDYATVKVEAPSIADSSWGATDNRALRLPNGSRRGDVAWSGKQILVDLNLTDGRPHRVSLYMVDLRGNEIVQRIEVLDAANGKVLDVHQLSQFNEGAYVSWNLTGHVYLRVVAEAGKATLSGVFIDQDAGPNPGPSAVVVPPSAGFIGIDATSKGEWTALYGQEGAVAPVVAGTAPAYGDWTISGADIHTWAVITPDPRGLIASGLYRAYAWRGSAFTIDVNLTDGKTHEVSLYMVDWDSKGRSQRIELIDPATGKVLDSRVVTSFSGGQYLSWNVTGKVQFRVTGPDAVISGMFFDRESWIPEPGTSQPGSDRFVAADLMTRGDWRGVYGSLGAWIPGDANTLSSHAKVTLDGGLARTWSTSTTERRALLRTSGASRIGSSWDGRNVSLTVDPTDGEAHRVTIYLLDWFYSAIVQKVEMIDPATGKVLDSRVVSSSTGGVYLSWNVTKKVQFVITGDAGSGTTLGAIFMDPSTDPATGTGGSQTGTSGPYLGTDPATQGSWRGTYGAQGVWIPNDANTLPSFAKVTVAGGEARTWVSSTTDRRALQRTSGASRIASSWYGHSLSLTVDLTDGKTHKVSLYLLDWFKSGRVQQIDMVDPLTGKVLDSREAGAFGDGKYLSWNVTGKVRFVVTCSGGIPAMIGGILIDPAGASETGGTNAGATQFVATDPATQGSWQGTYGSQGAWLPGDGNTLSSFAKVTVAGGEARIWASSTTDRRALLRSSGSTRIASSWYGHSLSLTVDLTDGKTHQVSLYLLDWFKSGRVQKVDMVEPATGKVLDSREIGAFDGGKYLSWNVTGKVRFVVTCSGGIPAMIGGIFID